MGVPAQSRGFESHPLRLATRTCLSDDANGRRNVVRLLFNIRKAKYPSMNIEIRVGRNESLETAISRFKQACRRAGLYEELQRRQHYEKPSVKRKNKARRAEERRLKEEKLAKLRQARYESRGNSR